MKPDRIYLLLFIAGTIVPYWPFVGFLTEHGLNLSLIGQQIVQTHMSAFAWADVIVSAVVTLVLIRQDGAQFNVRWAWLPVLATLTIGVSAGLPLFLYLRERSRLLAVSQS